MSTEIGWTHAPRYTGETWNFIKGCKPKSKGCANCYAIPFAHRLAHVKNLAIASQYEGLTERLPGKSGEGDGRVCWTGIVKFDEKALLRPLSWQKPRLVFVNSMADLWYEGTKREWVDRGFAIMAQTPQHIYMCLTKRTKEMMEYLNDSLTAERIADILVSVGYIRPVASHTVETMRKVWLRESWPLKNVWPGTSVEDAETARERLPLLAKTKIADGAVRMISAEPLLEPFRLVTSFPHGYYCDETIGCVDHPFAPQNHNFDGKGWWVVAGGESGNRSRPCRVDAIENIVSECLNMGVPVYVKQLGRVPIIPAREAHHYEESYRDFTPREKKLLPSDQEYRRVNLRDAKGAHMGEWPTPSHPDYRELLRVRQFPAALSAE